MKAQLSDGNIRTQQAFHGRVSETLNELADLLDKVLRFVQFKEREQFTERISSIKRDLMSLKSRLEKDHNLTIAVKGFNRIYLQIGQLHTEIGEKENAMVWNKENRRKTMSKSNKYQQAMEQLVDRDTKIRQLSEQLKKTAAENIQLKEIYETLLQQHHTLKMNVARYDADTSNTVAENRQLQSQRLYLVTTLQDTTSRLETMVASDKDNRQLLEKGAARIKRLSEELQQSERCASLYEKTLQTRDNEINELKKIIQANEIDVMDQDTEIANRLNEIKHLNLKIVALEDGVINIRNEYNDELVSARKDLSKEKENCEVMGKREEQAKQLRKEVELLKGEIGNLRTAEERAKTTATQWQDQCTRTKEELRSSKDQLSRCHNDLERRIAEHSKKQAQKDTKISDLEHDIKERNREKDEATRTIDSLKRQLASTMDDRHKAIEQKNKYMTQYLAEQSLRKSYQGNLNGANAEIQRLKQQRIVVDRQLERLTKEMVGLQRSRISISSQIQTQKTARVLAEKQGTSFEAVIEKLRADNNEKSEELSKMKQQLKFSEGELKQRVSETRRLQDNLRELERRWDESKRKQAELRQRLREIEANMIQAQSNKQWEHLNHHQVVMEYISQLEAVKQQYEQYRSGMEEKIGYLNGLIDKLNKNVEELDDCINENKFLREDNDSLSQQLYEMREQNCLLQHDLEETKADSDSKIDELLQQIDRVNEKILTQAPRQAIRYNRRRVLQDIRRLMDDD